MQLTNQENQPLGSKEIIEETRLYLSDIVSFIIGRIPVIGCNNLYSSFLQIVTHETGLFTICYVIQGYYQWEFHGSGPMAKGNHNCESFDNRNRFHSS